MSNYFCHECAISSGKINPFDPSSLSLTGSTTASYQFGKFVKHTIFKWTGFVSIFINPTYAKYKDHVVSGSLSGFLEIDDKNRKNMIYYVGSDIGFTFNNGSLILPNDATKIVYPENPFKIHAFPISITTVFNNKCENCGRYIF